MRRTIVWPIQLERGGVTMTPDPAAAGPDPGAALRQLIRLALLPSDTTNPWIAGQVGTADQTFKATTQQAIGRKLAEVRDLFAELERTRRARLLSVSASRNGGTLLIPIEYLDLETQRREQMEVSLA
jgi:hypothetical protein